MNTGRFAIRQGFTEITGAAGDIQDPIVGCLDGHAGRSSPPGLVAPHGVQPVVQVVSTGDRVEHAANPAGLVGGSVRIRLEI